MNHTTTGADFIIVFTLIYLAFPEYLSIKFREKLLLSNGKNMQIYYLIFVYFIFAIIFPNFICYSVTYASGRWHGTKEGLLAALLTFSALMRGYDFYYYQFVQITLKGLQGSLKPEDFPSRNNSLS